MYGHVAKMAESVAKGASKIGGVKVDVKRVPETIPADVLEKTGAFKAQKAFMDVPVAAPAELADYGAIIFGTPTRFGNMASQMRAFLDQTGGLWQDGALIGKVGSVFTSTATQHGGQESTILSFHTTLLHHGMVIVGLPYSFKAQMGLEEVSGGSPYGSSTISGTDGSRLPSENELEGAQFQGRHVAEIALKLFR